MSSQLATKMNVIGMGDEHFLSDQILKTTTVGKRTKYVDGKAKEM